MTYVKLGIFQGQGMHRKRHAVIMSVTFFYKNKTLSRDILKLEYTRTCSWVTHLQKNQTVLLYALGQSAKDSKVLLWFSYHYCNGYSHSRLNFLGFFTSGAISILLSPQSALKYPFGIRLGQRGILVLAQSLTLAFCAQGVLFAEERQTREEWLEKPITPAQRSASGCATNGRQSMVLVSSSRKPQTTNSCYSADAKKHTTQTNFLKTAFWVS